jgi:PST family polysaccharide transporter
VNFEKIIQLRNNSIVKNLFALGVLQLTNYLIPLIFVPYIIRVVGIEKFGLISFSQALMIFLAVITDYGFNLSSTREVSLSRDDQTNLSSIYSVTFSSKLFLGLAAFLILVAAVFLFPKLEEEILLHLFGFSLVLGQLLFPVWLFQGLEKMQYITILNFFSKVITLVCMIIFIKDESDYLFVLPCYASGPLATSVAAMFLVRKLFQLKFSLSKFVRIKDKLVEGFSLFLSNISVTLYSSATLIILGAFATDLVVGYYSAAEKIMMVPRQLLGVFSQAIYSKVCLLADQGYHSLEKLWRKLMPPFLVAVFLICLATLVFSNELAHFVTGHSSKSVSFLIKLLSFVPFIVALNIKSYQTLLAYNLRVQCLSILVFASLSNILINGILSYFFGASGTVISLLITETIISVGLYVMIRKWKRRIINKEI